MRLLQNNNSNNNKQHNSLYGSQKQQVLPPINTSDSPRTMQKSIWEDTKHHRMERHLITPNPPAATILSPSHKRAKSSSGRRRHPRNNILQQETTSKSDSYLVQPLPPSSKKTEYLLNEEYQKVDILNQTVTSPEKNNSSMDLQTPSALTPHFNTGSPRNNILVKATMFDKKKYQQQPTSPMKNNGTSSQDSAKNAMVRIKQAPTAFVIDFDNKIADYQPTPIFPIKTKAERNVSKGKNLKETQNVKIKSSDDNQVCESESSSPEVPDKDLLAATSSIKDLGRTNTQIRKQAPTAFVIDFDNKMRQYQSTPSAMIKKPKGERSTIASFIHSRRQNLKQDSIVSNIQPSPSSSLNQVTRPLTTALSDKSLERKSPAIRKQASTAFLVDFDNNVMNYNKPTPFVPTCPTTERVSSRRKVVKQTIHSANNNNNSDSKPLEPRPPTTCSRRSRNLCRQVSVINDTTITNNSNNNKDNNNNNNKQLYQPKPPVTRKQERPSTTTLSHRRLTPKQTKDNPRLRSTTTLSKSLTNVSKPVNSTNSDVPKQPWYLQSIDLQE